MPEIEVRPTARPNTLWQKLIAGGSARKSRLHDELGRRISLDRALRNAPRAAATGVGRVLFGRRPERPWISYDGQAELARILTPASRVLEFGSGMSTMWYARRAGSVVSIEDHSGWYEAITPRVRALGNVDYRFAEGRESYLASAPDEAFDLIVIDGNWRDDCARFAIAHLGQGGIIYLDNSDKDASVPTGNVPEAARILMEFAQQKGLRLREFTDFAPTQFFVQRGLMVGG